MALTDKVLVTGASGFVGSAVARRLFDRGFAVTCLVRGSSPRTNLDGLPFDIAVGDMTDQASVEAAARGARYLFHVAADYRIWARDPEEIVRANREGTGAVMRAARAAGVERIVYTSSVATLGTAPGADKNDPADETHPLTPETAVGAYKRSKVIAERLVERMVAEEGLPAVIVNPSTPIGPRDVKPTPTGRIIVDFLNKNFPAYVDTGLNLVDVAEVARTHAAAGLNPATAPPSQWRSAYDEQHHAALGMQITPIKMAIDKLKSADTDMGTQGRIAALNDVLKSKRELNRRRGN